MLSKSHLCGVVSLAVFALLWRPSLQQTLPVCLSLPIPPTTPAIAFKNVVAFGASWMDDGHRTGGAATATAATSDPNKQFTGRASNGPTLVEFLAKNTGLFHDASAAAATGTCRPGLLNANLTNMAFSGASCDNKIFGQPDPTKAPFSVVQQVQMAIAAGLPDSATTLYVFLPATQDITGLKSQNDPVMEANVAACYQNSMLAIAAAGGKNFVLATSYPYNMAPETANSNRTVLQQEVAAVNAGLYAVPAAVKASFPTSNTWVMDMVYVVRDYVMANAQLFYGAGANIVDACSAGGTATAACQQAGPDLFLWWDGHHPTRKSHSLYAQVLYYYLSQTPFTGPLV
ncbi:hypothetical protein M427DRAFT_154876 [Gonapodya prolifera JEL478]|uniref:Carbohydrate esterase family 16 protein n=1 Tax=Gonapodya prolifera (strain JEL478) TaxID=1344416 RepID=A0A139AH85_GONPJ|nr:hypothetical protein M427DRAFT_154876 [Gonapodya prolifera JEL478]|eukprot:KXS16166.1 hypothetical protein M427DRAFT_154876 [Gonapodya prolifera JEL478]